jgi:nucleoside 2-deoxyribosyltransferase
MSKPYVYLAGPIASRTYGEATGWRREAIRLLGPEVTCLDPMRDKEGLADAAGPLGVAYKPQHPMLSSRAIVARDHADLKRADVVLMILPEASIGTLVELGWADAFGKTIVAVIPPSAPQSLRDHPFIRELADVTVATLGEAIGVVRSFLALAPVHE